jgi:hypothetical protein
MAVGSEEEWQNRVARRFEAARWVDPDRIRCPSCRAFVWQPIRELAGEASWLDRPSAVGFDRFNRARPRGRPPAGASESELRRWDADVRAWCEHVAYRRRDPARRRAHLWRVARELLPLRRPAITVAVPPLDDPGLVATLQPLLAMEFLLPWRLALDRLRRLGHEGPTATVYITDGELGHVVEANKRLVYGPVLAIVRAGGFDRNRKPIYRAEERAGILEALLSFLPTPDQDRRPLTYVTEKRIRRGLRR